MLAPTNRAALRKNPMIKSLILIGDYAEGKARRPNVLRSSHYITRDDSRRNLPVFAGYFAAPRFSYHFKFVVAVPIQTTSGRPSPFKSATAQPAAPMPPSSRTSRDQRPPLESS